MRLNKSTLLKTLRIASDIIPKLPSKDDSLFTIAVKLLGIADSWTKVAKHTADLHDFFLGLDAETTTNAQFVALFFRTKLSSLFELKRFSMGEHADVVRASHPDLGTLWFIDWRYNAQPVHDEQFWFSRGFRFDRALVYLWVEYDGGLHLGMVPSKHGRSTAEYSRLPRCEDPLFGDAVALLDRVCAKHRLLAADHVPTTYLLVGDQGTGKSTFALRFAEELGERTLRIDATSFTTAGIHELDFLLEGLRPRFLIVDDVDRAPELAASLPTLLTLLTDFRTKHPEVTIVLTANDVTKLDAALLRPGRIDEILDFAPPSAADRRQLLRGYCERFMAPAAGIDRLVDATEGMGAAYLRHFAQQLVYESLEDVLAMVARRQKLAGHSRAVPLVGTDQMPLDHREAGDEDETDDQDAVGPDVHVDAVATRSLIDLRLAGGGGDGLIGEVGLHEGSLSQTACRPFGRCRSPARTPERAPFSARLRSEEARGESRCAGDPVVCPAADLGEPAVVVARSRVVLLARPEGAVLRPFGLHPSDRGKIGSPPGPRRSRECPAVVRRRDPPEPGS